MPPLFIPKYSGITKFMGGIAHVVFADAKICVKSFCPGFMNPKRSAQFARNILDPLGAQL